MWPSYASCKHSSSALDAALLSGNRTTMRSCMGSPRNETERFGRSAPFPVLLLVAAPSVRGVSLGSYWVTHRSFHATLERLHLSRSDEKRDPADDAEGRDEA